VLGIVGMLKGGDPAKLAPAIAGMRSATAPAPRPATIRIVEKPAPAHAPVVPVNAGAATPVPLPETETPDEPEEPDELTEQHETACEAVDLMENAGWEQPGDIFLKIARFAVEHPDQARHFLGFLG